MWKSEQRCYAKSYTRFPEGNATRTCLRTCINGGASYTAKLPDKSRRRLSENANDVRVFV